MAIPPIDSLRSVQNFTDNLSSLFKLFVLAVHLLYIFLVIYLKNYIVRSVDVGPLNFTYLLEPETTFEVYLIKPGENFQLIELYGNAVNHCMVDFIRQIHISLYTNKSIFLLVEEHLVSVSKLSNLLLFNDF